MPTSSLELWTYRNGTWEPAPYQIDDVSGIPFDIKVPMQPGFPGRYCVGEYVPPAGNPPGPCEFLYDLRGESAPTGEFTENDEIVFLAGSAGSCSAPVSSWPDSLTKLASTRYRIEIADSTVSGTETGCVYLFRRTAGSPPAIPDLVDYDPTGDGVPATCLPISDACGAITGRAFDVDGDGSTDVPAYRFDFYGDWTIDKWKIGETCGSSCANQDMADLIKWRIDSPDETERLWDLYQDNSKCGSFVGYLDGPVRVVRVIEGAASGALTRKLEFAYPGEILTRVYMRVHSVEGPAYTYPDLLEANVSAGSTAKVYKKDYTGTTPFDTVDGKDNGKSLGAREWYQVSSSIGSFLFYYGTEKFPAGIGQTGEYDDTDSPLWQNVSGMPEWDAERGDRAAARTEWGPFVDTQNLFCDDPAVDLLTPILEHVAVMLSTGEAASNAGAEEMGRRDRGVLSRKVVEQHFDVPGPNPPPIDPCKPSLSVLYGQDGGPVELQPTWNCQLTVVGWNIYQTVGVGVYKRVGSLSPGRNFVDATLFLDEERTYRATTLGEGFDQESPMSDAVTVVHNDIVAPPPPDNVAATATAGSVTVTWDIPVAGDLKGYKVLAGTTSGGPYEQVHSGLIESFRTSVTFQATGGQTTYIVTKAMDMAGNESDPSPEVFVEVP